MDKKNDDRSEWNEPPKSQICLLDGTYREAHVNSISGKIGYVYVDGTTRRVEWFAVDGKWYEAPESRK